MIYFIVVGSIFALYFLIPRGTNLHEIIRLPHYNYLAQTARKDDMIMEKHRFGNHNRQYLVFFSPKDKEITQNKVIIYIHGGGWTFGNPMMFRCNAQFFVDRGYAVVMPTYRRLPYFRSPDMQEDSRLALKKTIEIMQAKGIGNHQIILGGLSSGAHLAALLAYDRQEWSAAGISRSQLTGIMLLGAPLDLSKMMQTPVLWRLAGNRKRDFFKVSNPVNHLMTNESIPVLMIHGTKDGLVNYKSALSFAEKHGTKGLTFHTIEGGTHLDAGYWVFEENVARGVILEWLKSIR